MNSLWQPSASLQAIQARADILTRIRHFFAQRKVLEVDTPLLSHATVTDPHITSIAVTYQAETLYLQTSPEYAMKRLLATGFGSIYQLGKAFRSGDRGQYHNPEFTLLEWYRTGFDHHALMDEMDELLQSILSTQPADRMTCGELYQTYLNINPHTATAADLQKLVNSKINLNGEQSERTTCLELLFSHCVEPYVAKERPLFLYDFPIDQAALACIRQEDIPVASRFEVYYKGLELANGFHELADAAEQSKRFENDLLYRQQHQFSLPPIDEHFLAALKQGLPDCAGVALGIDRLIMLAIGSNDISEVINFPIERA